MSVPRIFLLLTVVALLVPGPANADTPYCTCYNDAGVAVPFVNATNFCTTTYGSGAVAAMTSESGGYCAYGDSVDIFACGSVCTLAGYNPTPPVTAPTTPFPTAPAAPATPPKKLITPTLSVEIPGVSFTEQATRRTEAGGKEILNINFLGEYIAGVYKYLLGIATTIAIVMIMISGLQWAFSGGSILGEGGKSSASKAKERIKNSIVGLVLLMGTYLLLYTVNPQLVLLQFPELTTIPTSPLAIKFADETERAASCKDRPKIALTDADKSPMSSPYTSLTVPTADSCASTKVPQAMRDEGYKAQQSTGVPAALLLAQWGVESGYGKHCVGEHKNNCWGIKCTSGGKYAGNDTLISSGSKPECPAGCGAYKTKEVKNGVTDDYWACFQDFATLSEAMEKHAKVVKRTGWDSYNGNPEAFAKFVQNNCYATAENYASAITATMSSQCLISK